MSSTTQEHGCHLCAPIARTPEEIARRLGELRVDDRTIVFTNGCFDILHAGHAAYLEAARSLGDALVVGVNSDRSVRAIKGPTRPLVPQEDRLRLLAALRAVDLVILFDEETPLDVIHMVAPDILVKGGDYSREATSGARHIIGSVFVLAQGGEVRTIPLLEGRSTSSLIERIRSADRADEGTAQTPDASSRPF